MSSKPVLPAYSMNRSNFPRMYEDAIVGPLFRPWAEALLDRAGLEQGMRVLDVACGTGIVARLAQRRLQGTGRVVGVDVSGPMLEVAREIEPGIDWREGDAAALPVAPDEQFDRVLCQQGLQFFGAQPAAAAELRRVLAAGGVVLAAIWRAVSEMPLLNALQRVAERRVGAIHDARYAFGDAEELSALLSRAGFREVVVQTESQVCRFPSADEFVRMNAMALLGMSTARLSDEEREQTLEAVAAESLKAARPFLEGDALACEFRANIAVAR